MKKIVFIINERTTGGFTSALSSLYDVIKTDYNIQVIELTSYGHTPVSYESVCIKPSFLCDGYFSDFTASNGFRKFRALIARLWAKIINQPIERLIRDYQNIFEEADCIIAYSEGKATQFASHILHNNKIAWIHNDAARKPYNERFNDLYSSFRKVVCVADTIAEGMKNKYPILSFQICSMHNITDVDRVLKMSAITIEEVFGDCINIISLGRIVPLKRFSYIPAFAKVLADNGVHFKWRILGPDYDKKEAEKIIREIEINNVADKVEWLGLKKNPYPYIKDSDILVCTSESEACPMIFTEARVLNTLIITSDFPSSYEFIENEIDGIITPFESIPKSLLRLATNSRYYNTLLKASTHRCDENKIIVKKFSDLINGGTII